MRLTKKLGNIYVYNFDKNCDFEERKERSIETHNKIIDKFGQLEDIEEEFEIDLIILFKAIKNGIAFKMPRSKNIEFSKSCILETETLTIRPQYSTIFTFGLHFDFKDYGKTWALTKEELL